MQQIYRRTLMPKCDFNKVALQLFLRTPDGYFWMCFLQNFWHFRPVIKKLETCTTIFSTLIPFENFVRVVLSVHF